MEDPVQARIDRLRSTVFEARRMLYTAWARSPAIESALQALDHTLTDINVLENEIARKEAQREVEQKYPLTRA